MKSKFKLSSFFLSLVLLFNTFMPMLRVFANAPDGDLAEYGILKMSGAQSIQNVTCGDSVTADYGSGNVVTVKGTNLYTAVYNNGSDLIVYGLGKIIVSAVPSEGYNADLEYCDTSVGKTTETYTLVANEDQWVRGVFTKQNNESKNSNEIRVRGETQQGFDGKAYFMWLDDNDNLCYHKFSNLIGKSEDGGYDINYVHVNELTDESGNGFNYTFGRQPANWILASEVEDVGSSTLSGNVTKEFVFGNGEGDIGKQLDPCNAKDGANSICTNGGRNFRATIYRDGYQSIKFDTQASMDYFPDFWDPIFFSSTIDISGTTPENPAVLKTYLLNNFIIFNIGEHSNCLISSVKPLNVDEDVVDIDYESDAGWYIWFKSNYYDHVVFEITAENGNKYYIRIDRVTFGIADTFGPNQNKPQVVANFYYPSDYSYEEFDVLATKVKKDGSEEIFIVNASEGIDLITGDSMQNDTSGRENLKKSEYLVDVDDTTAGVYFAVVYKGALNGEKEVYDGTFSGSGKGVYYDITSRQTRYDV